MDKRKPEVIKLDAIAQTKTACAVLEQVAVLCEEGDFCEAWSLACENIRMINEAIVTIGKAKICCEREKDNE